MQLVIQVSPLAAVSSLHGLEEELGIRLEPLHPGTSDPGLARYFKAEMPGAVSAAPAASAVSVQGILSRLREHEAVAAAYLKPPDELP